MEKDRVNLQYIVSNMFNKRLFLYLIKIIIIKTKSTWVLFYWRKLQVKVKSVNKICSEMESKKTI